MDKAEVMAALPPSDIVGSGLHAESALKKGFIYLRKRKSELEGQIMGITEEKEAENQKSK